MQIGICPAKETMPNGISSDKTDSAGINYAAILIIRKADLRRQSRQAEAENVTFRVATEPETAAEAVASSLACPRLLVKAKFN